MKKNILIGLPFFLLILVLGNPMKSPISLGATVPLSAAARYGTGPEAELIVSPAYPGLGIARPKAMLTCDVTINSGADVDSAVSSASAGQTICLNAGTYPNWDNSVSKASQTIVTSTSGVASDVSIAGLHMGPSSHITVQYLTVTTSGTTTGDPSSSGNPATHVYLSHITFDSTTDVCIYDPTNENMDVVVEYSTLSNNGQSCNEGRLTVHGFDPGYGDNFHTVASGIVIRYNTFSGGDNCSDGVHLVGGTKGTQILYNEFADIIEGGCGPHADSIQFYGPHGPIVTGNYFHNVSTGIMSPDCNGQQAVVTGNIFDNHSDSDPYPDQIIGSGSDVGTYDHNTIYDGSMRMCACNCTNATNAVITNNIVTDGINLTESQSTATFTIDYNNFNGGDYTASNQTHNISGTPTFSGGTAPSTWAGYQLTAGSVGHNAASDGIDIGANYFGSSSPATTVTGNGAPLMRVRP